MVTPTYLTHKLEIVLMINVFEEWEELLESGNNNFS